MLDGVMLLWFVLTALSLLYVVLAIRSTPESPVLKWGFILLVAYTGPFGVFLYVLGCREPLPGLHERYVAVRWRQVLGSTMHCVAGDGVGILAGAVIASLLHLTKVGDISLEYFLGFSFGWAIFQALFMRAEAGGSYARALSSTFLPELLSMNFLMAGMVPTMVWAMKLVPAGADPSGPAFWFIMSMALLVGFISAYPMNGWLVSHHLKHGMMTVRAPEPHAIRRDHDGTQKNRSPGHGSRDSRPMSGTPMQMDAEKVPPSTLVWMTLFSFLVLAAGLGLATRAAG